MFRCRWSLLPCRWSCLGCLAPLCRRPLFDCGWPRRRYLPLGGRWLLPRRCFFLDGWRLPGRCLLLD